VATVIRGLRCVVQIVYDEEGAVALYTRAGFVVGPARQFGDLLVQRDIQVPGFYLSLNSPPQPPRRAILDLLDPAPSPGFAAVELEDPDPRALWPAGSLPGVGTMPMPELEHIEDEALQRHPNSVAGIAGLVIVAKNPSDHHIFLSELTGQRELRATSAGVTARTSRGELSIVDPLAFRGLYGTEPPQISKTARAAALRFRVKEQAALIERLRLGAVPHIKHMGHVVIEPATAMGGTLVFEGANVDRVAP
jgi:hypothetical protein